MRPPTQLLNIFKCVQNWKAHSFACVCVAPSTVLPRGCDGKPGADAVIKLARHCRNAGGKRLCVLIFPLGVKNSPGSAFSLSLVQTCPPPHPSFFPLQFLLCVCVLVYPWNELIDKCTWNNRWSKPWKWIAQLGWKRTERIVSTYPHTPFWEGLRWLFMSHPFVFCSLARFGPVDVTQPKIKLP